MAESYYSMGVVRLTHKKKFQRAGRNEWEFKKPSPVLNCACGNKYLKTRRGQKSCVFCILHPAIHRRPSKNN